ncbi:MAG TPA: hypothetical protein P5048_00985 [Chlamydiales bacterium]|nr:hypothetical protein [Chlamydiales bacterium]
MKDPLKDIKDKVLENLLQLKDEYNNCIDAGMLDDESSTYNSIETLIDALDSLDSMLAIENLCDQGKIIESQLDFFLEKTGQSTLSLEWPDF